MEAKKKIQIVYDQASLKAHFKSIIRIHIPRQTIELGDEQEKVNNSNEQFADQDGSPKQIEKINSQKAIEEVQVEQQPKVGKWDFDPKTIDIFDGKGYHPNLNIPSIKKLTRTKG